MYNIAIIGVGALGKHHLESVLKSDLELSVYVIDSDQKAVEEAVSFDENRIIGGVNADILPEKIDVAVIATSSGVRRMVFEQLVAHSEVRYVIFEKVLFQRNQDYYAVEHLLRQKNIRAWVNCAKREQAAWQNVKEMVSQTQNLTVHVTGGSWGLGCNGIHMLDMIEYLSDEGCCKIDAVHLLPIVKESKRAGYKEVFGTILGSCGKCQGFSITCYPDSALPLQIEVSGEDFRYVITEGNGKAWLMKKENGWKVEEQEFLLMYQSQMTQRILENILMTGNCNLPGYAESMKLHLKFLEPLILFFEEQGGDKGLCPIT